MCTPCWQLPSEVWTQVWGFLPHADKLQVRTVCKDFKDLIDSSGVWRDWTLTLRSDHVEPYNDEFWCTLRRWRLSSLMLTSRPFFDYLATVMPQLTSLIVDYDNDTWLEDFQCFTNLERLYLRRPLEMVLDKMYPLFPKKLVHLSICEVDNDGAYIWSRFTSVLRFDTAAHLKNLKSFVCHASFAVKPEFVIPTILSAFPQLSHLSVLGPFDHGSKVNIDPPEPPSLQHHPLSSLEIVKFCDTLLDDAMKIVPSLRSLALYFSGGYYYSTKCMTMNSWLRDLPGLTSLVVVGGPPVKDYVKLIPSTVTRLKLHPTYVHFTGMSALSAQLPNLRHLHLEPLDKLRSDVSLIPRLFPGLRSLRICLELVPMESLLSLAALKELQLLETQDEEPPPAALVSQLQDLTGNRLQVSHRPKRNPRLTCYCLSCLPTPKWGKAWT